MEGIIQKLRFRNQERVAVINAPDTYLEQLASAMPGSQCDNNIDQRFLYGFMIVFVKNIIEIRDLSPDVLHNLSADGILWFVYPKKSDINRDHGWEPLEVKGFKPVSKVAIDDEMSALRFRNVAFIKPRRT